MIFCFTSLFMLKKSVIVIGAGAWGGWSAYCLQQAGCQVTLVDKSSPGNAFSGSGGKTRVIRMAYGGNEIYTEMVDRSFQLWDDFCALTGEQVIHPKEALWMFNSIAPTYAELSQPLMQKRGFALEEIPLADLAQRYPQINLEGITSAYIEPKAAYLEASRSCGLVKTEFEKLGGRFLHAEIAKIEGDGEIDTLITLDGERLKADHYVFACGPWMKNLFPSLAPYINITRQEVYYFDAPANHLGDHLPIWLEFRAGDEMYYGIPDHLQQGFKLAYDQRDWALDPDKDDRDLTATIFEQMNSVLAQRFPALKGAGVHHYHTCVYENSLDGEFIMDNAPNFSNGIILCGSSGHGFKMGPAVGEMVAQLITQSKPFPSFFALDRLKASTSVKCQFEVG
jgi:glycine/D-amino acid oxidase-like deaminating enzyme